MRGGQPVAGMASSSVPGVGGAVEIHGQLADRARDALIADLYGAERTAVFEFLCGMVGERSVAEDLTHDAFLTAYRCAAQLRDPDRARAWLFAIARNAARQHMRRGRFVRWVEWTDRVAGASEGSDEARSDVVAALMQLKADDREIALLKGLLGFTAAEIGQILGIREDAAQRRWQRARERLRAILTYDVAGAPAARTNVDRALSGGGVDAV